MFTFTRCQLLPNQIIDYKNHTIDNARGDEKILLALREAFEKSCGRWVWKPIVVTTENEVLNGRHRIITVENQPDIQIPAVCISGDLEDLIEYCDGDLNMLEKIAHSFIGRKNVDLVEVMIFWENSF